MIKDENNMIDIIPNPISREINNKLFLWLNKKDLLVIFTNIVVGAIIWLPLLFFQHLLASLIVALISIFLGFFLTAPFTIKPYEFIYQLFGHNLVKDGKVSKIKCDGDLFIKKIKDQNWYIKIIKVSGIDTDLIDSNTQSSLYNNLSVFFEMQNKNDKYFDLIKIESHDKYGTPNYSSNNKFINQFMKNNSNICNELTNEDDRLQSKIFVLIRSRTKNNFEFYVNQLTQIAKRSRLEFQQPTDDEIDEIKFQIWNENCYLKQFNSYIKKVYLDSKKVEFIKYLGISKFPNNVNREWIGSLCNIKNTSFVLKMDVLDELKSQKFLDKAISNVKQELNKNKSSANQREIDILNYEILMENSKKIAKNGSRFLSSQFILVVKGKTKDELLSNVKKIKIQLKSSGVLLNELFKKQFEVMYSIDDQSKHIDKLISYDILSSTMGFGFPYFPLTKFDNNAFILGVDESNQAIAIDFTKRIKNEENSNIILQGMAGGGKTTTAKEIMMSQIASNEFNIYVIDPENEYSNMVQKAGGEIVDLGNPNYFINPFHFINSNTETLENQLENNSIFFNFILEEFWNVSSKTHILNACKKLYLKNKNEFTFTDLYNELIKNKNLDKNVLNVIELYTKNGVYGSLWDKKTNIKLDNSLIAFNFQEITNSYSTSYKETKMFLLLKFLEHKVIENRKLNNKLVSIFIDEGHLFTSSKMKDVLNFIFNWYKRIRKYKGMLCFITQNINDLLGNKENVHLTSAIVNNSHYWIFLKLTANEVDQLDNLLINLGGLSDYEKEYLITAERGQSILFIENLRTRMQVIKKVDF